ncbi:MAG TPA: AMP-binding protein [Steroidobacteraceae bacterium]
MSVSFDSYVIVCGEVLSGPEAAMHVLQLRSDIRKFAMQNAYPTPRAGLEAPLPESRPLVSRTMGDLLLAGAEQWPTAHALVHLDERISYAELADRSWQIARSLAALGIRPRQKIGVLMHNSPELVATLFGISLLGAVVVPINARYRSSEIAFLTRDAELSAILTTARNVDYIDFVAVLQEAFPGLNQADDPTALRLSSAPILRRVVLFGADDRPGVLGQRQFNSWAERADLKRLIRWCEGVAIRDVAAIIYTSGTTANPRGAILTHEAFVRAWMMVGRRWGIRPDDRFWNPCPLFHIAGLGPLMFVIGHGATFVTDSWFDPGRALRIIARERATLLYPTYPPITQALISHPDFANTDLGAVRVWLNVAPPDTLRQMAAAIPHAIHITTYGSTEGGPVTMNSPSDSAEERLTTCGDPLPGNDLRVVDPQTRAELPPGTPGEIIYRGYNVFSGYYNDPDKTAATIDADGWVLTGDVGTLDERGMLLFQGRIKDMLKIGGENVAPSEVESYLSTHPAVKLVQVVGIPDSRLIEVVAAFVELQAGATVGEAELISFCRGRIASFKVPRFIRFVTEWPMSATKIQRNKLREQLIQELQAAH